MGKQTILKATLLASAISGISSMSTIAEEDFKLEEVIVTAQKREQSLQDVPIAVQAIGADMLKQISASTISDIGNMSPGLSISNASQEGTSIAIRGIGTSILGIGFDQSVPLYLDGVYLGRGFDLIGDLMDVEQIEVLKGPQGTLFGRNAAAGAVNVTTQAPHEETEGAVKIGVGKENLKTVQALYNTALSDNVYARVNASWRVRDGWQENLDGGDDLNEQDQATARAKLLWDASDSVSVLLTADYSKMDNLQNGFVSTKASPGIPTHDIDDEAAPATTVTLDGTALDPLLKRESEGYSAKIDWKISDDLTLTSITSYRTVDIDTITGGGAITTDLFGNLPVLFDGVKTYADEYSQEFRLSGANDKADWFVGFNYYRSEGERETPLAMPVFALLVGTPLEGTLGDDNQRSEVINDSYSAFGDVIWHLSDRLNLTTGLRYSYDDKTLVFKSAPQRLDIFFAAVPSGFLGNPTKYSEDWKDLSGRVVLDYQLNDDTMVFAGVSQGYKSGGFGTSASPSAAASGQVFEPFDKETTTNYEAGVKTTLMDNRLRLNASVFYTEFENYQLQIADLEHPATSLDLSAPEAISQGVDLELVYAATENLTLNLNTGYLETEYAKDVKSSDGTVVIPEGQDLLRAPRWTTTAGLDYVISLSDIGDLRFNASYTYRTSQRLGNAPAVSLTAATRLVAGDPGIEITESDQESGAYGLLNARLSLLSADETWEVAVWGTNLTDKAYRDTNWNAYANAVLGAVSDVTGVPMAMTAFTRNEPRMWGVDFTYNF